MSSVSGQHHGVALVDRLRIMAGQHHEGVADQLSARRDRHAGEPGPLLGLPFRLLGAEPGFIPDLRLVLHVAHRDLGHEATAERDVPGNHVVGAGAGPGTQPVAGLRPAGQLVESPGVDRQVQHLVDVPRPARETTPLRERHALGRTLSLVRLHDFGQQVVPPLGVGQRDDRLVEGRAGTTEPVLRRHRQVELHQSYVVQQRQLDRHPAERHPVGHGRVRQRPVRRPVLLQLHRRLGQRPARRRLPTGRPTGEKRLVPRPHRLPVRRIHPHYIHARILLAPGPTTERFPTPARRDLGEKVSDSSIDSPRSRRSPGLGLCEVGVSGPGTGA